MAQPPLPPTGPTSKTKNNKEITKLLRLSSAEHAQILEKVAVAGLTFSEYMRRAALGVEIKEKVPPAIRKHASSIANNLNQLTRLANSGKLTGTSADYLQDLVKALTQVLQ